MTKTVTGALSTAPSSNATETSKAAPRHWLLYCLGLGAAGVALHAGVRLPLHVPGHHGLEWMALLAFARLAMPGRWAATGTGTAAAAMAYLPVWGFHDPFAPLVYLVAAVVFDALCLLGAHRAPRLISASAGGLAFLVAGLIPYLLGPHGAEGGVSLGLWAWAHFAFGLTGALIGAQAGLWTARRRARER